MPIGVTRSNAVVPDMSRAPAAPSDLPAPTVAGNGPAPRDDKRRVNLLVLCGLALIVGVMTGCGAVALRALIGFFHNAFYNGTFSIWYDANISEGPSRFGDWVLLSPVLGGLVVVFLVQRFAPEAKGHGVPEVMDAVFYKHGNIRGQVAIIKSLASALSIGSGAAVGREGPIIQIGAALGSAFSQAIKLSTWQKITLLAAGAGAGIAATFNTPLGGVLFALEILLPEVSNRTFLPVVVATGAATTIGRILIGPAPAFVVPDIQLSLAQSIGVENSIAFVLLGILCGVASWAFIRLLVVMEDGFPKLPGNAYTQNILGMAIIGLMMVVLTHAFGHPYVDGVGYGVIQSTLDNQMTSAGLLALLFVLKMLATTISLGCGASGGIFSPSLYLGAASETDGGCQHLQYEQQCEQARGGHLIVEGRLDHAIADAIDIRVAEGVGQNHHHQADDGHAENILGVGISRQLGKAVLHDDQQTNEGPGCTPQRIPSRTNAMESSTPIDWASESWMSGTTKAAPARSISCRWWWQRRLQPLREERCGSRPRAAGSPVRTARRPAAC